MCIVLVQELAHARVQTYQRSTTKKCLICSKLFCQLEGFNAVRLKGRIKLLKIDLCDQFLQLQLKYQVCGAPLFRTYVLHLHQLRLECMKKMISPCRRGCLSPLWCNKGPSYSYCPGKGVKHFVIKNYFDKKNWPQLESN